MKDYVKAMALGMEITGYILAALFIGTQIEKAGIGKGYMTGILIFLVFLGWVYRIILLVDKEK